MGQVPKVVSNSDLEVKSSLVKIWIPIIRLKFEGKNEVITFKSKAVVHENFASVSKSSIFFFLSPVLHSSTFLLCFLGIYLTIQSH